MSIRKTQKDQYKSAKLTLVTQARPEPPKSKHPLIFWTQHKEQPVEVDLREFAEGKPEKKMGYANEKTFTGRPGLIQQLRPIIEDQLALTPPKTVVKKLTHLRAWWALLDRVETNAATAGIFINRLDDVRQLTILHREAALSDRMNGEALSQFRGWVDIARQALGAKPTYWHGFEKQSTEKYIPPLEKVEAVRQAVKRECLRIVDQWDRWDRLKQLTNEPDQPEEAAIWRGLRFLHETQKRTGNIVPTLHELNGGNTRRSDAIFARQVGMGPTTMRHGDFVSRSDALAIFSQCIATTGWNAAVMLGLDVATEFLRNHPKDDLADPNCRWVLTGIKERARGTEQVAVGPWKVSYFAGSLITRYMQRVEPLREALKTQLENAQTKYAVALREAPETSQTKALFKEISELRRALKSIWICLDANCKITALDDNFIIKSTIDSDGKQRKVSYLESLISDLNSKRQSQGKSAIPNATLRDFRLWFADYLHRSYYGNVLVVMLGLGHKSPKVTQSYLNTNLTNRNAETKTLEFQEILTEELDFGRIDLTILAYKVRHGAFDKGKEEKLAELRQLPRSRQGIGCRDPRKPPQNIQSTPGQPCDSQRCLLCTQHAVLLPESMDGIAMREAELQAMRSGLPMTVFVDGGYQMELENQEQALLLFDPVEVYAARVKWVQAISDGRHIVPGFSAIAEVCL